MGDTLVLFDRNFIVKSIEAIHAGFVRNHRPELNYVKFSKKLCDKFGLNFAEGVIYDCYPYKSSTAEEASDYKNKVSALKELETLKSENINTRYGTLKLRQCDYCGRASPQQKRVDMLLAIDFIRTCLNKKLNNIILVAGDEDFLPLGELALYEKINFYFVYTPTRYVSLDGKRKSISGISDDFKAFLGDNEDKVKTLHIDMELIADCLN